MLVVLVTLLAALSMQTGYFLWKISADKLPTIGKVPGLVALKAFMTSPIWLAGMVATAIGWLLLVKATDLGEVSIVQPLMSVGDLFLVVIAVTYLHEKLLPVEWLGLALTVIGAVVLATEAKVVEPRAIEWGRLAIFIAPVISAFIATLIIGKGKQRREMSLALLVGLAFGTGALLTELFTASIALQGGKLESSAFFLSPFLPAMVIANMVGVVLLQSAFQQGRAAVVIPVQLAVANGLVVIGGAVVFLEPVSLIRLMGIAIIIAGTGMLHRLAEEEQSLTTEAVRENAGELRGD